MKNLLPYFAIITALTFISCNSGGGDDGGNPTGGGETQVYDIKVTITPDGAGTISPSDEDTYEAGKTISLRADAQDAYIFSHWTGGIETTDNPLSLTVDQDYLLIANFKKKNYALSITTEGEGTVTERIVPQKSREYEHGTVVELIATPGEGYTFAGWKGATTSTENPLQITVDEPKEITAIFEKKSYELTVNVTGKGAVSEEVIKAKEYDHGTVVELTATAAEGWKFVEWQGEITSTRNSVQITVDSPKEVTAVFEKKSFKLTVKATGGGTVEKSPYQYQSEYKYNTMVDLTANPDVGWIFIEWQGAITSTDNPVQITMDSPKEVTAVFEKKSYELTVHIAGEGTVSEEIVEAKAKSYEHGTMVKLTATPSAGWVFVEWEGAISSTESPVQVTVDAQKEITAVFGKSFYLAANGVTVKCPNDDFGDTGMVNGITYTKRRADQITPSNAPTTCTSGITNMYGIFKDAYAFNGDISSWDVSNVKFMIDMFDGATSFNGDISNWDVSQVISMKTMFFQATSFNSDISGWDVSSVTNMMGTFWGATAFNQDLNSWDVSSVTNMGLMFLSTDAFNQDLNNWDVSNVTDMNQMFGYTNSFNGDISSWDVSSVTDMRSMFSSAKAFNNDISNWDVKNVTDMSRMFQSSTFNQDLSGWCVTNITSEPINFSYDSPLTASHKPVWGTCPASP